MTKNNSNQKRFRFHCFLLTVVVLFMTIDILGLKYILASTQNDINLSLTILPAPDEVKKIEKDFFYNTPLFIFEKDEISEIEKEIIESEKFPDKEEEKISEKTVITLKDLIFNNIPLIIEGQSQKDLVLLFDNKQPLLQGLTGLADAYIHLVVFGEPDMVIMLKSDKQGFFQWRPLMEFSAGKYSLGLAISPFSLRPMPEKFYIINFEIKEEEEIILIPDVMTEEDGQETTKPPVILETPTVSEIRALKELTDLSTRFFIDPNSKRVFPPADINFEYIIKNLQMAEIDSIEIRLVDDLGRVMASKEYAWQKLDKQTISDSFSLPENFPLGTYYLQSLIKAQDLIVSEQISFEVLYQKILPFFGEIKIDSTEKKLLLFSLVTSMIAFVVILFYEILILFALKKNSRVEDFDLDEEIVK